MKDPSRDALLAAYSGVVCDLDGVVYRGAAAVPEAVASLRRVRRQQRLVFATNNASRTPEAVAAQLSGLGLPTLSEDVLTSAQVGAVALRRALPAGSKVLAVGGEGVRRALLEAGFVVVTSATEEPVGVLQGYGTDVRVRELSQAALAVQHGAMWIATNTDRTVPIEGGLVPGNGTLVDAVRATTTVSPVIVGKPFAPLYLEANRRMGLAAAEVLGVGDRLDTDIAGAAAAAMDSVWVLTGVDGLLALASASARPTYAVPHLGRLHHPYPAVRSVGDGWTCGAWLATVTTADTTHITQTGAAGSAWPPLVALALVVVLALRDVHGVDARPVRDAALAFEALLPPRNG